MRYIDGYVLPVPKKRVEEYQKIAQKAGKIWIEHGALQYLESVAEDAKPKFGIPFPKMAKLKPGETVVFSWVIFKSRAHRDKVNAKVMADPRLAATMNEKDMPFDCKRMTYGGFTVLVDL